MNRREYIKGLGVGTATVTLAGCSGGGNNGDDGGGTATPAGPDARDYIEVTGHEFSTGDDGRVSIDVSYSNISGGEVTRMILASSLFAGDEEVAVDRARLLQVEEGAEATETLTYGSVDRLDEVDGYTITVTIDSADGSPSHTYEYDGSP
ncbi:hypothetical protein [Halosegnis marinus]|uniref:DUF4426 domain-containing protein n=1 Tax=Halosegnis marinus TaxID=3034023 RepID=A0ABD5ZQB0_9EURY|nr:hypothetical protein [Halosegnis sp. DT85]